MTLGSLKVNLKTCALVDGEEWAHQPTHFINLVPHFNGTPSSPVHPPHPPCMQWGKGGWLHSSVTWIPCPSMLNKPNHCRLTVKPSLSYFGVFEVKFEDMWDCGWRRMSPSTTHFVDLVPDPFNCIPSSLVHKPAQPPSSEVRGDGCTQT